MYRVVTVTALALCLSAGTAFSQMGAQRPLSGPGRAATQVAGEWTKTERGNAYQGGKWIEVTYNRPMLRQRPNIFGSGAEYGKTLLDGGPVWRAGANQTTRFKTDVPLRFGSTTLPAGEYSMLVDLKEKEWTLIMTSQAVQQKYDPNDKTALWGGFNYTPEKDVLRVAMKVETLPFSVDELTISFLDVTKAGGRLAIMWDKTLATVPFMVAGT
ncbi:MAG: DUF2911 domain-containing protein [Vicinamibacterales bacterium]